MNLDAYLGDLWKRGTDFLGSKYALLGGAMTWVSERHLVSALSNAGAVGVLACGSMDPDRLKEEIRATAGMTDRPFGVNLIVLHPQVSDLVDVCIEARVPYVVFAGGLPPKGLIDRLHQHQIRVIGFAPALVIAKRLMRMGIDALILEGSEAGGHIGPVSTTVLAQEILPHIRDVPVFVAGGIGRGETILSFLEMGAAGCQLGTRFVCTTESQAHPRFKQAFIQAQARHATVSKQLDPQFPVIPVRSIENEGSKRFVTFQGETIARHHRGELSQQEAQLAIEHYWSGALRKAVVEGDVENGSLMAGQSVGMVSAVEPTAHVIQTLLDEMIQALNTRQKMVS